jgi:phospholipid-binding lipoprotein MlaA
LGLFDVASDAGLEKHKEDFGQTLGVWGVNTGPYVVLPLFGPSNVRDTVGFGVDLSTDFVMNTGSLNTEAKVLVNTLRIVNFRANTLDAEHLVEEAALDRYSFIRDSYLQRRRNQVYDGDPPPQKDE